jgi:hypothetical protein
LILRTTVFVLYCCFKFEISKHIIFKYKRLRLRKIQGKLAEGGEGESVTSRWEVKKRRAGCRAYLRMWNPWGGCVTRCAWSVERKADED